jgi:hypothetical protein
MQTHPNATKFHTIIVLSDGETWNTIDNCSILTINDRQFKELCQGQMTANDLVPIQEICLKGMTPPSRLAEVEELQRILTRNLYEGEG